jgi:hypothetical protein
MVHISTQTQLTGQLMFFFLEREFSFTVQLVSVKGRVLFLHISGSSEMLPKSSTFKEP